MVDKLVNFICVLQNRKYPYFINNMEQYLRDHFHVSSKHPSDTTFCRWRSAVFVIENPCCRFRIVTDLAKRPSDATLRHWRSADFVKNHRCRFRMVADLAKQAYTDQKRKNRVSSFLYPNMVSHSLPSSLLQKSYFLVWIIFF